MEPYPTPMYEPTFARKEKEREREREGEREGKRERERGRERGKEREGKRERERGSEGAFYLILSRTKRSTKAMHPPPASREPSIFHVQKARWDLRLANVCAR